MAFFSFIFRPFIKLAKFLLFKLLAKTYLNYLFLVKRLGWNKWRGSFVHFLLSQRTVHVLVVVLVLLTSFSGIMSRLGQAKSLSEDAGKTLISKMVAREFYDNGDYDEGLIEEEMTNFSIDGTAQFKYGNSYDELSGQLGLATTSEDGEDEVVSLSYLGDDVLVKPESVTTKVSKKTRKEVVEYTVKSGDSISTIASDFDISVNTILWENGLTAYSLIRPGDKLVILPSTGINHKVVKGDNLNSVATSYGVEPETIVIANKLSDDQKLVVGQKIFIPGGRKKYVAPATPKPATSSYNPIAVIKDLINPDAGSTPANKMFWPAKGVITQYYTWRHHGLDIANKQGTPIYSCESGTIVYASWSKAGYGNMVEVDHGNGKHTRYGHFYQISVKVGDKVERGQVLGLMGTTGKSTGPHLHLEVRINNVTYNPLSYIK